MIGAAPQALLLERRKSSFVTVSLGKYLHHGSLEILSPYVDCPSRKSTLGSATFNLMASMIGGGVLSLPIAFQKAGIIPAIALTMIGAVLTNLSLYLLCSCSRKTGAQGYNDIVRQCFGPLAEFFTTVLLFLVTFFSLMAYMVLIMDIWSPILRHIVSLGSDNCKVWVLVLAISLMTPFLVQRDLYSLRHICYVGFASVVILCSTIGYRSIEKLSNMNLDLSALDLQWYSESWMDLLFSMPIIVMSYFAVYNILGVHSALQNPTQRRVKTVLSLSIGSTFVLYLAFGLLGYLFAQGCTQGNILLNFDPQDSLMFIGRIGMGTTILFAMPIVMVPCREAVMMLPIQLMSWYQHIDITMITGPSQPHVVNGINFDDETLPLTVKVPKMYGDEINQTGTEEANYVLAEELVPASCGELIEYGGTTVLIVILAFIGAVAVPGVAIVWSIVGSSVAMILGFFIPSACYLKIRWKNERSTFLNIASVILLMLSIAATILCTYQTVWRLNNPETKSPSSCSGT